MSHTHRDTHHPGAVTAASSSSAADGWLMIIFVHLFCILEVKLLQLLHLLLHIIDQTGSSGGSAADGAEGIWLVVRPHKRMLKLVRGNLGRP